MSSKHLYHPIIEWTGNKGSGTFDYRAYSRSHTVIVDGKADILASSDSSFRGEKNKHNPEDLFVASIAGCHMLWYLHLCSENGIIVLKYLDCCEGVMIINPDGSGHFEKVVLMPQIVVSPDSPVELAKSLHSQAHKMCFIARSCNFPILCEPSIAKE